jgi:hypothetical protein
MLDGNRKGASPEPLKTKLTPRSIPQIEPVPPDGPLSVLSGFDATKVAKVFPASIGDIPIFHTGAQGPKGRERWSQMSAKISLHLTEFDRRGGVNDRRGRRCH